jgi:hypothetical protein
VLVQLSNSGIGGVDTGAATAGASAGVARRMELEEKEEERIVGACERSRTD